MATMGGVQRRAQAHYEAGVRSPDLAYLVRVAAGGVDVGFVVTGLRASPGDSGTPQLGVHRVTEGLPPRVGVYPDVSRGAAAALSSDLAPLQWAVQSGGERREYIVIEHITEPVCAGRTPSAAPGASGPAAAHMQAGPIAFERRYMAAALGRADADFLTLNVEGDSMSPALLHGDLVAIDTQVTRVNVSGIYVLRFDGDLTIKRVTKRSDGSLVISSDNPQYSRGDEVFTREQAATLQVIGRMVWPRVR
jgi:hypothetical protein